MADKPINDDEDRIVQFIPPQPLPPAMDDWIARAAEPAAPIQPIYHPALVLAKLPHQATDGYPMVNPGDPLSCLKCGREWKSRRGGLKPCPACGDKDWWKEFDLAALANIEARLAAQSSDLQPAPSSGRVNCRLVLEVYEPGGPGGNSSSVVGVYRKVGAGWPDGGGLGVLRFKVDEAEELMEIMALVKGMVNAQK